MLGRRDQQIAAVVPSLGRQGGGLDLSTTRSPQLTNTSCSESLSSSSLLNSRHAAQISVMKGGSHCCFLEAFQRVVRTHFMNLRAARWPLFFQVELGTELRNCGTRQVVPENIYATLSQKLFKATL